MRGRGRGKDSGRAIGSGDAWIRALAIVGYAAASVLACAGPSSAQARLEGLAGSGSALLTGVEAVNPACLANSPGFTMRLVGVAADASNNSFSLGDYDTYNGTHFTAGDKADILAKISESLEGHSSVSVGAPSFSVGSFALTSRARGGVLGAFPKAVFELLLNGNTPGRDYTFDAAQGSAMAVGEARLSHGRMFDLGPTLGRCGLGITLKYLYGGAYAQLEEAHGSLTTDPDQIHGEGYFRARTALGGSGFGFDLGATRDVGRSWTAALTLQDIGSSIRWTRETKEANVNVNVVNGNLHSLDNGEDLVDETHDTRDIAPFRTTIPAVLSLGFAHKGTWLTVAADWEQGFSESALTDTTPRFAVGAEAAALGFLVGRGGASAGGRDGMSLALGLGLKPGPVRLDLSVSSRGGYLPGKGRGIGAAFAFGIST